VRPTKRRAKAECFKEENRSRIGSVPRSLGPIQLPFILVARETSANANIGKTGSMAIPLGERGPVLWKRGFSPMFFVVYQRIRRVGRISKVPSVRFEGSWQSEAEGMPT
jgi:hypothetical protein